MPRQSWQHKEKMELILIAAVAKNGVIGKDNKLPWSSDMYKQDLRRFRTFTMGKPLIMGRNTFESILSSYGEPFDGRISIVISGSGNVKIQEGVIPCLTLDESIETAENLKLQEAYVIGGERVYRQAILLPHTTRLEITEINKEYEGDKRFPFIDLDVWKEVSRKPYGEISFVTYERRLRNGK